MIEHPGIYHDIPAAAYHADPCVLPSLSSSVGRLLLNRSPRHAWMKHPRLNPSPIGTSGSRDMDLGSVVHELILGRGAGVEVIEADSYRTKAAQEAKAAVLAAGKTPILREDHDRAVGMASIARAYLAANAPMFADGADCVSEAVLAWKEGPEWCRAMIDRITPDMTACIDIKTTAKSARADAAARTIFDMGYHFQAAFYERGLNVIEPQGAGRRNFIFLFQEADEPFECQLIQLDEAAMTIARKQVMAAIGIWRRCLKLNVWPGYPPGIQTITMPDWQQQQWLNRELADDMLTGATGQPPEPEKTSTLEWTP